MENIKKLFIGRLGRLHYFLGNLIILGIGTLVVVIYPNELLSFIFSVFTLPISIRRLHDVDMPGYLAPIGWLSYFGGIGILVAVIFNLFLLFKKGNEGANKYGEAPKPKTKFIDAVLNREVNVDKIDNKKSNIVLKVLGWILVIVLFFIAALIQGERTTRNIQESVGNFQSTVLQAEQVNIPSFVKYSNTEAGFDFSILFPTTDLESFDLDLGEVYIKSFQAPHVIDLEQSKFAQYSVFFSTPKGGKILSDESVRAYLENYPKGKSISSGGILSREEITTYKGLVAVEYVFSSEMQGVSMTHKGIAFVVDGIPIDLSVVYTDVTSPSNIFYDDYIKSFAISAN